MFREMRRNRQQLSREAAENVLKRCTSGVLAVSGDEDYPYAVPLSYFYEDGNLWFHCAKTGHKIDSIRRNEKVSFCVIEQDQIVPEKFTTYFRSVIVFGRARIMEDEEAKILAVTKLADKYSPHMEAARDKEIADFLSQLCMVEIEIEHITGKEAIELVNK